MKTRSTLSEILEGQHYIFSVTRCYKLTYYKDTATYIQNLHETEVQHGDFQQYQIILV
jgi:hypothetical protein